ncbi:DNA-3-methyladenine glycosylase II [Acetobacter ascendens]|uniref:DNA-3-methyladenine glycosylase II n=1 Tax=Acetobacter ascendens TaxID=481146 RepID=A0A1Y0V4G4_9PROT|nr:DNA-3-methyladenine glycosylase II [Acetobacter ascendens]
MLHHQPDIRIRRVYEEAQPDDGARVLVDRLWPRGVSKERAALTLWLKDIAPPPPCVNGLRMTPPSGRAFANATRQS